MLPPGLPYAPCVRVQTVKVSQHLTLIVCVYVAILPQASVAVNVLVIIRWNPVAQLAGLSVEPVMVTVGVPHASDAVGLTTAGMASVQLISTLAGVLTNAGAWLSAVHVMVLDAVTVLPQASLAVNVLV